MTSLGAFIARIAEALAGANVSYMFVGSIASTHHGAPRSTQDVDLVVALGPADISRVLASFPDAHYYVSADAVRAAVRSRGMFNIIDLETGWKADFVVAKARPFSQQELARRLPVEVLGVPTWIATAEDTIVAKLEWSSLAGGSARQQTDVSGIIAAMTRGDEQRLDLEYIEHWTEELGVRAVWDTLWATRR